MCSVSAVSQYYTDTWPNRFQQPSPFSPGATGAPLFPVADSETREMMRQVLKLLDKIDKKLGDVECMDAEKAAFLKALDIDPAELGG